jgi:segregation and condensation protein B
MSTKNGREHSLSERLEALLFVAPGPLNSARLAAALQVSTTIVENGLKALESEYEKSGGLRLQRHRGRFQLTSAPEFSADVERLLGLENRAHLSRAALETLAIVAYRRPVTRPQVDEIRGVNSDSALRSLMRSELVEETGRAPTPGRPILYSITNEFLQHFGLDSLDALPPLNLKNANAESFDQNPKA